MLRYGFPVWCLVPLLAVTMLLTTGNAQAGLVGQRVSFAHLYGSPGALDNAGSSETIIAADSSDTVPVLQGFVSGFQLVTVYWVDGDNSGLTVRFWDRGFAIFAGNFVDGLYFNGLVATFPDLLASGQRIVGVRASIWDSEFSRYTFTDNVVSIDWEGKSFSPNGVFRLDIDLRQSRVVSEPSTIATFGMGLIASLFFCFVSRSTRQRVAATRMRHAR
jgi:hypothetical protein